MTKGEKPCTVSTDARRNTPYLSIVASSRNDDHGGDMHKRMQTNLTAVVEQMERFRIQSELVLVDYNPPPDRPLLKDALALPTETRYCTIRTVVVPSSVHWRYRNADKFPFHTCVAPNVGVRRARGKFILFINIDILLAHEYFQFVADRRLEDGKIYRTDRYDVDRRAVNIKSLDERLAFCRDNVLWIHTRNRSIPVVRKKKRHLTSKPVDFSRPGVGLRDLHYKGPDAILMSKEAWHSLRGMPEIDIFGLGLDTVFLGMAYLGGIREELLPDECRAYHIDHAAGWRKTEPSLHARVLFYLFPDHTACRVASVLTKVRGLVISDEARTAGMLHNLGLDNKYLADAARAMEEMENGERPAAFNGEEWGLGDMGLEEYVVARAAWEG